MDAIGQALLQRLEERGYRGRIVSIGHLAELEEGIERWHRQGALNGELYRNYLSGFRFSPEKLAGARSLIVVANPQPALRLLFTWRGEVVAGIIPPTYVHHVDAELRSLLAEVLGLGGYAVERAIVPLKFLAVRSGLARYGRNNVSYVPGLGSFQRLAAFCSDLPCDADSWQEPALLEACEHCSACRRNCPTGAIAQDRFLLHAEQCLTWHNERPAAMPGWVEPAWHHTLIGCLRCQETCPENRPFRERIEQGPEFSAEETELLLQGVGAERLPEATLAKLAAVDWAPGDLEVLGRNLGLLIRRER